LAKRLKAVVVGAGFGGLTAVQALRTRGVDAILFEQADDLRKVQVGSGLTFWVNAALALKSIGLLDAVEAAGARAERSEFWSWRRGRLATWPMGELGRKLGAPSVSGRRGELHKAMTEVLEPGVLRLGHELVGFDEDGSGITVQFANGHEERTDVLVGADGLRSRIRDEVAGPDRLKYAGYTSWNSPVEVEHEEAPFGLVRNIYGDHRRFYYHRVGYGRKTWVAVQRVPVGRHQKGPGTKQYLLELFRDWPEPVQAFLDGADDSSIHAQGIYRIDPLDRWGAGRVTLLGDAAHAMTFDTGQGACQAVEDSAVLARRLGSAGDDPVAALRGYEDERRDRAAMINKRSRRVGRMALPGNAVGAAVRDAAIRLTWERMGDRHYGQVLAYDAASGVSRRDLLAVAPA
jgi:2-polyprenyl-6-methoxyphenol hydroxylase-like FAD-dependent oxidoreductase